MTVKISIVGLGQIGASIGLALANHKDQVTTCGYDSSPEVSRKAQNMEAVESLAHNLAGAVKGADVVVLALPLDQIQVTLESIAQDIREDGILLDTTPVKQAVAAWMKELLPLNRHYVGLTPAINPIYLEETETGIDAAHADLFRNGLVAVTAPPKTASEAIKLATSFVSLLGARPYFADLAEVDGIMAAVHTLPSLVAVALTEAVIRQDGWADIRKLAGRPFVGATRLIDAEEPTTLAEETHQNQANTVRLLDDMITTLHSLRDEIEGDDEKGFRSHLGRVVKARTQWRKVRTDGDWQSIETIEQEIVPKFSDLFMQQLGLGKLIGLGRKTKKEEDE